MKENNLKEYFDKIAVLREEGLARINAVPDSKELDELRIRLLGKKSELMGLLKQTGTLDAQDRPIFGAKVNEARQALETALQSKTAGMKELAIEQSIKKETLDVTLPARRRRHGKIHPMNVVLNDLKEIFYSMGYTIVDGPEIEKTKYVFDMLNTAEGHPARDEGDTFYIDDETVLRTQTSSVQIRAMLEQKPPIAIISPGAVYRFDEVDATHSPVFHQCEALVVDKNITFSDLKGTLEIFIKRLYGNDVKLRFRPHHFPYTEPSAEVDLSCFKCSGNGCSFCKGEGWIEMLGCGVVHPVVLQNCGIDPNIYSGFAFGVGLERITMMRYEIDDMRLLYENDARFLNQF